MKTLTPSLCPLCNGPNACAMEIAKTAGQPAQHCWCVDAVFTAELMDRIPANAKGVSCVCAPCAQAFTKAGVPSQQALPKHPPG